MPSDRCQFYQPIWFYAFAEPLFFRLHATHIQARCFLDQTKTPLSTRCSHLRLSTLHTSLSRFSSRQVAPPLGCTYNLVAWRAHMSQQSSPCVDNPRNLVYMSAHGCNLRSILSRCTCAHLVPLREVIFYKLSLVDGRQWSGLELCKLYARNGFIACLCTPELRLSSVCWVTDRKTGLAGAHVVIRENRMLASFPHSVACEPGP
ncbi:unnamed protein product [Protopolystoma xenopodis]|uniref:Uncharacterized protein n=1 Tax=Protopolystoma xenopodis TaxID=117903 RepID=A0A3S5A985_9PLAT|nr:unnamed protein product [Protopolystoma xenopodis]